MKIKFIQNLIDKLRGKKDCCIFKGDFKTFEAAQNKCTGYDAQNILNKTLDATLKVKNGEAVFERDSVLFDKIEYSFQMLTALYKAAAENNNKLNVLDFGGALGSHYFQNKEFLKPVKIESWTVVEQPHYVKAGNEQVSDGILKFKNSIVEVENADIVLLGSVLQYLDKPYEWLEKIVEQEYKYIFIDRTAFSLGQEKLTIQVVPKCIYDAQYPAWFLDEKKFSDKFKDNYELLFDYVLPEYEKTLKVPHHYKAFLFRKKD